MIIIYEPDDMTERARTKAVEELTLQDLDVRVFASPTIFITKDGVARRVINSRQEDQPRFEIDIAELMRPCTNNCSDCDKPVNLNKKGKCENVVRDPGASSVYCNHQCAEPTERARILIGKPPRNTQ